MRRLAIHLAAALIAAVPAVASAEWRAAETPHFVIYSEQSDGEIAKLAERLERVDGLLRLATGISEKVDPVKVRIYAVKSTDEVDKALGLSGSGIAGFYDNNIFGPFAVSPRDVQSDDSRFTPELVLNHEYAHHFMLQYFPSVYPQWYVEGFAELIGASKFLPDGRIGYGTPAKYRGDHLSFFWVPVQEVLSKDPHKLHNFDLYGQGWALTHYLTFSKERSPQLRQYLLALKAGKPPEQAAKAFGDLVKFNQDAHKYLRSGSFAYRPVAINVKTPVLEKIRVLSAGEAALIQETIAFRDDDLSVYRKEGDRKNEARLRAATLKRIRDKSAQHSTDPFATYLLAEAEYTAGNYAQSEAAADRLLAIQPDHVRGKVRKALNMLQRASALKGTDRTAAAAEARRLVVRANKDDPNDVLPLIAYYRSFHMVGEVAPKAAVEGLIAAVETVPGDVPARQLLVDEFARQRQWARAIHYLRPIADAHHDSPRREAARKQVEELVAALAKEQGSPDAKQATG